ncbi:hypothetical protein ANCDUO_00902 [Ancylostoma duodenale]|uniref:Uncharacterized protein n=1 Tax=Ancylostoma duodenale TaxID=51022 RepID=A0A0C2HAU3_9BILA|nr:hypothetical protein ANCDUO_00902 [Ancylostoma duodenale]
MTPCSEVIKNVQPTAWYAIPVAVISSLFRITQDEVGFYILLPLAEKRERSRLTHVCVQVMCEYTRDIDARTWIVRHSFPPNRLTKLFLNKFSSRFLSNGYDINPTVVCTYPSISERFFRTIEIKRGSFFSDNHGTYCKDNI